MREATVTLLGCGDVGPVHEPVEAFSALVRPTLAAADVRFAQVERVYSERGELQPHSGGAHSRLQPHMASVFSDCGFDVVSLASNHAMDWGGDALIDTVDVLRARGITVIGAGRTLDEARRPGFVERNGVRMAFLAFCSVLQTGYAAERNTPGVSPLRVHTRYEPVDYQPGVPPRIITVPDKEDLAAMVDDIARAKQQAQVVVLSMHWGIHFIPRLIADYQVAVAQAAFEAGADLILGHHAHVPKAIGVYGGKICFFSLSNFIMSAPPRLGERAAEFIRRYGVELDQNYPNLPYGKDAKRSLIAKAVLSQNGVERVSFLPVLIDRQLRPEMLRREDPRFDDAIRYMEWASEGFDHRFVVDSDEVAISGQ